MNENENRITKETNVSTTKLHRRRLLAFAGVTGIVAGTAPSKWTKPLLNSVVLPAHAQTSICMTDSTVGGPLIGHPSGGATCQAACEFEANAQSAQLCAVNETVDGSGATQCECEIDLP